MSAVFLVSHTHALRLDDEGDVKILGVFSTEASAKLAIRRAKTRPGFRDHPKGFSVDRYELDRDEWSEGFLTVVARAKKKKPASA